MNIKTIIGLAALTLPLAAGTLQPTDNDSPGGQSPTGMHDTKKSSVTFTKCTTFRINDIPASRTTTGDYPINFEKTTQLNRTDRYTAAIALNGSSDGDQSFSLTQQSTKLLYQDLLANSFTAKAGETVTPMFSFAYSQQPWMHGYVYLDRGNDGTFTADMEGAVVPEGSDIMTFSHLAGKNSKGETTNAGTSLNPPSFVVPDLPNGFYRMRYKIDWDNVDPGGNNNEGNLIWKNGGSITDIRLNIHGDEINLRCADCPEGSLTDENGTAISSKTLPFGQPFTIVAAPASANFVISHITVRHGYNLEGDSLVHGTAQYTDDVFPAYLFRDNKFTIPGKYMDGDVIITPHFVDAGTAVEPTADYERNFADDLTITRTDRKLNSFSFSATNGGSSTITLNADDNRVYRDMTDKQVSVIPGDAVSTTVDYTGRAMHLYLYVDLNNDGMFLPALGSDGIPGVNSELISYSYYDGRNSLGSEIDGAPADVPVSSIPTFTLPAILPTGVYRARLKVDWNNIDPAGRWSADGPNNINDNGGYVVDFLLNVHSATHRLDILTENGSIHGSGNTALPLRLTPFQALQVAPTPAATGYYAEKMVVKHGHNFDGPQYIHGNRQWGEYELPAEACTIPADSINGDVQLSVAFAASDDAAYKLVFSDEFDGEAGSGLDPEKWECSPRQGATWNRWIADDIRVAFQEDGQFVARAIPNPDRQRYSGDMITGAMQTSNHFGFQYGKIECRLLTNPHTGNFPAFWLMPDDQHDGWPNCGEIDIWEQIDNQERAYHTLHTGYRQSMYSANEYCATDRYHTYGFEWDASKMIWYLDGKEVGRYNKSNISDPRSWPFDKTFYIILNQSVGSGAWAAMADINHTYETRFDWVRVYQKKGQNNTTGLQSAEADDALSVNVAGSDILLNAGRPLRVVVSDLGGRQLFAQQLNGSAKVSVSKGVYIVNGHKILVP